MKILALMIGMLLGCQAGYAGELPVRTYNFKTYASSFTCREGIPPNGHNFPIPTTIRLSTSYGASGIYYATKLPLNNTDGVEFSDSEAKPCSAFADLLQAKEQIPGEAIQKFETTIGLTGTNECFKVIREELTIRVKGYELHGLAAMHLPMERSDCPESRP